MNLNWNQCLKAIMVLAIVGYALVIYRGFWPVLTLLVFSAVALCLWRPFSRP